MVKIHEINLNFLNIFSENSKKILLKNNIGLQVIPLVETFTNMEYVLKLDQFSAFREGDQSSSLCVSQEGSISMVKRIIDQILELHPKSQTIHLGTKEVWSVGTRKFQENSSTYETIQELVLRANIHLKTIYF